VGAVAVARQPRGDAVRNPDGEDVVPVRLSDAAVALGVRNSTAVRREADM
jgi:hypothetical protein